MKKIISAAALLTASLLPTHASAFCGFYVAKADTGLFNESSQVVYARNADRSIVTMGSDFKGDVKEFAMVIPVPVVVQKEQVKLVNNSTIKHLDAYTAPRLVEYFDDDPCMQMMYSKATPAPPMAAPVPAKTRAKELGVTIEAQYTLGEYDIMVLSGQESTGLITWLTENGYKIPQGAEPVIGSYLKQNMKFFIAKVNLKEYSKTGFTQLRPIQVNYREKRFMLPIRLGTVNATGKQDLFIYALTPKGRVETTNYRTVKLPSDLEIPEYIKDKKQFANFYRDMFRNQVEKEGGAVFLEYAWDMNWCDPCAADPLSIKELQELGAFWVKPEANNMGGGAADAYVTRLHVRYDRETFPEDLMFQTTGNTENYQGRYIVRHPWQGEASCPAANEYLNKTAPKQQDEAAKNLAKMTGWNINEIRKQLPKLKRVASTTSWTE
jgi:hypothetical protein